MAAEVNTSELTLILPTHNRPSHTAAQLRFFRSLGFRHHVVVADSSNPTEAEAVRAACAGIAEYRRFDPLASDKLLAAVKSAQTQFVVMAPDDDIVFPHAIEAAFEHLVRHPDYVVAHGYTLRFGIEGGDVDIHHVYGFTPSINHDDPLERHYDLMRRYQPFFWAVFRREILVSLLEAARGVSGPLFQELMFMNAAVLQGKIAMLPMIYAMRGMESSHTPITSSHPLYWFLRDAQSFFSSYLSYRDRLADFIRARALISDTRHFPDPMSGAADSPLEQMIDIAHATWLGRSVDVGAINHAAQLLLGKSKPLISGEPVWPGRRGPEPGDLIVPARQDRRYIWRRAVLEAEPRDEILIESDERARVEKQLDAYRLD